MINKTHLTKEQALEIIKLRNGYGNSFLNKFNVHVGCDWRWEEIIEYFNNNPDDIQLHFNMIEKCECLLCCKDFYFETKDNCEKLLEQNNKWS